MFATDFQLTVAERQRKNRSAAPGDLTSEALPELYVNVSLKGGAGGPTLIKCSVMRKEPSAAALSLMAHSKIQLYSKLNFARRALEQGRIACAGDPRNARETDLRIRIIELRRVEQVERLGAKLQAPPFRAQREVLEQRRVHLLGPRTIQNIAARVAVGVVARRNEGRRVEPLLDGRMIELAGACTVRILHAAPGIQGVCQHGDGERRSGLERAYSVELPGADEQIEGPGCAPQQRFAFTERQFVSPADHEVVAQIEC